MDYKYKKIVIILILGITLYLILNDFELKYEKFTKKSYGLKKKPIVKYSINNDIKEKNQKTLLSEYNKRCGLCKISCKNLNSYDFKNCHEKCNNTRFCKKIIPKNFYKS